jgi:hypothetical protein
MRSPWLALTALLVLVVTGAIAQVDAEGMYMDALYTAMTGSGSPTPCSLPVVPGVTCELGHVV